MSALPNAVGRLDDVVEAIRDGDRDRSVELLQAKEKRLKAEELPIGTVMVLGGTPRKYETNRVWGGGDKPSQIAVLCFYNQATCLELNPREVQELIDRGVKFLLPEGGKR